jgi:MFS family permease
VIEATRVRYALLTVATANAFLLYLDRVCMGAVIQSQSFQSELQLSKQDTGDILATFFFAYALGQMPAGYLADRFGPRKMLVIYILLWSLATASTGLTSTLFAMIAVRAACGLAEAGAYPASGLLISRWFPLTHRARANSIVAFGGRVGNSLALWLTAVAISAFGSWRPVLWTYGLIGIGLALATHFVFRNYPSEHPWVNQQERDLIGPSLPRTTTYPWRALISHPGLWLLNLGTLGLNFGWAFLITWLPTYLQEVRGVDAVSSSRYVSFALMASLGGMLTGGVLCDWFTRNYGQRWGRRLPFLTGCGVAATAYIACPFLPSTLAVVIACGIVAFFTDSVMPAVWALGQDIGGTHVASAMAWSNMWGNFGASAISKVIPMILAASFHQKDWSEIFFLCAASFVLLALCATFIDSTKGLSKA